MMLQRTISAIIIAPPFLAAIWFGFPYFNVLICILCIAAISEIALIVNDKISARFTSWTAGLGVFASISAVSFEEYKLAVICLVICGIISIVTIKGNLKDKIWMAFGYIYIIISSVTLVEMRDLSDLGRVAVIWLFVIVWANDIGAYFFGRTFGSARIAPKISPGKTWVGTIAGLICAGSISLTFVGTFLEAENILFMILLGIFIGIVAQVGDFIESFFKRSYDVKDSGALIPGHGGVLDRGDSIFLAAPVLFIILLFYFKGAIL